MFDIAPTELLLVAIVALVVIGPKDLPRAMRFVGQWVGKARAMGRHFRSGIDEMVRQADLEDMERRWAEENARIMREHPQAEAHPAQGEVTPGDPSHDYAMTPLPPAEPGAPADTGADDPHVAHAAPERPRELP